MPDVLYISVSNAIQRLGAAGLEIAGAEKAGIVIQQVPAAGTRCAPGETVTLTVTSRLHGQDRARQSIPCPKFNGLSNRQVRSLAARLGVRVTISGIGYVANQEPRAGTGITDRKISLKMEAGKMEAAWH